jgi:3-dehydroquinate synthase
VPFEYPVVFSRGVFQRGSRTLADVLRRLGSARQRALFVLDAGLVQSWPELPEQTTAWAARHLELARPPLVVGAGEACKNDPFATRRLLEVMHDCGIDRKQLVMVVGGGALLDMAGFAAATAHRGVRVVRVPTTLLSQADSGVGVKCGVNMFGVKNFAGAFAPPCAVVIDGSFLRTLPRRELASGLAEAVKVALIRDARFFHWIEAHAAELARGDVALIDEVVRRSALLHLEHIARSGDPFERGAARPLDFGHWSAHKLESLSGYRLLHGEAVAIGMLIDAHQSVTLGWLEPGALERIAALLDRLGLPVWDRALAQRDALLDGLEEFRQHTGGALCVTLLAGIGTSLDAGTIDARHVHAALDWLDGRAPLMAVG